MATNETTPPPITLDAASAEWIANVLRGLANITEMDGPNRLTDVQLGIVARAQGTPDAAFRTDTLMKARNISEGLIRQLREYKG